MFTVKFYKDDEAEGREVWDVVSTPHYQKDIKKGFVVVVTYPSATNQSGVERRIVGNERRGYNACFVENMAGKTIDHVKAPTTTTRRM